MSWFDSLTASLIPFVPKPIMRRLSVRYIAGEEREAALVRGSGLAKAGYRVTYDQLGEAVTNRAEVEAAVEENLHLLEDLVAQDLERNISVKPTQLGLNLDEEFCYTSTARVVAKARELEGKRHGDGQLESGSASTAGMKGKFELNQDEL